MIRDFAEFFVRACDLLFELLVSALHVALAKDLLAFRFLVVGMRVIEFTMDVFQTSVELLVDFGEFCSFATVSVFTLERFFDFLNFSVKSLDRLVEFTMSIVG